MWGVWEVGKHCGTVPCVPAGSGGHWAHLAAAGSGKGPGLCQHQPHWYLRASATMARVLRKALLVSSPRGVVQVRRLGACAPGHEGQPRTRSFRNRHVRRRQKRRRGSPLKLRQAPLIAYESASRSRNQLIRRGRQQAQPVQFEVNWWRTSRRLANTPAWPSTSLGAPARRPGTSCRWTRTNWWLYAQRAQPSSAAVHRGEG
jgi:hypothetical protein